MTYKNGSWSASASVQFETMLTITYCFYCIAHYPGPQLWLIKIPGNCTYNFVGFVVVGVRSVVVRQSADCEWFELFLRWRGRRLLLCTGRSVCGLCVDFTTTGWLEISLSDDTAVSDVLYNKLSMWFSFDECFITIVDAVVSCVIGVAFACFMQTTSTSKNPLNVNEFIIYKKKDNKKIRFRLAIKS